MPNAFQGFPTIPRLPWDDLYLINSWESKDSLVTAASIPANIFFDDGSLVLRLNQSPPEYTQVLWKKYLTIPLPSWNKERLFRTQVEAISLTDEKCKMLLGMLRPASGYGIGFEIDNGVLKAYCGGEGGITRATLQNWGAGSYDKYRRLEARFTPGASVQYYVDGILAATITTTLPAGDKDPEYPGAIRLDQGTTGYTRLLYTAYWMYWQES